MRNNRVRGRQGSDCSAYLAVLVREWSICFGGWRDTASASIIASADYCPAFGGRRHGVQGKKISISCKISPPIGDYPSGCVLPRTEPRDGKGIVMCDARLTLLAGVLTVTAFAGVPAAGQIPDGWEIVEITNDPEFYDRRVDINDRGQIVFQRWNYPSPTDSEIMLYDRGVLIQITDDDAFDWLPRINNHTEIVWERFGEDGIADIMLWRDGVVEVVSGQPYDEYGPDINDAGQIVWDAWLEDTHRSAEIFLFDGTSSIRITNDRYSDQVPRINENGQIAWTRYEGNWDIMLYNDGAITPLAPEQLQQQGASLNDLVHVVWSTPFEGVQMWDDGGIRQLLEYGQGATINNRGDVSCDRPDAATNNYTLWVLRQGTLFKLTDGLVDGYLGQINQGGEIAFQLGEDRTDNIALFTNPIVRADFDFDEDADLADFAVLQNCLGRPEPLERACLLVDRDFDNDVDLADYEAWFALFAGPK